MKFLMVFLCLILLAAPIFAQDTAPDSCSALIEQALASVGDHCDNLDRNSACYGHYRVDAHFIETDVDLQFDAPADRVTLTDLRSIATAPYDLDEAQWGVAVLKVQANLPDTLPGQAVTFLLMGDAQITDDTAPIEGAPPITPVEAAATSNANLRSGPGTDYNIAGSVTAGQTLTLTGSNATRDWYRISDDADMVAWIWGNLIDVDADALSTLPVVTDDTGASPAPEYGPMQAFTLSTGVGLSDCSEAPNALLVRTPEGTEVNLRINNLDVTIGSTVLFFITDMNPYRPTGEHAIVIVLIEGQVTILAPNGYPNRLIEPGSEISFMLDDAGQVTETSEQAWPLISARDLAVEICPTWAAADIIDTATCAYLPYPSAEIDLNPYAAEPCAQTVPMGRPVSISVGVYTLPAGNGTPTSQQVQEHREGFEGFAGTINIGGESLSTYVWSRGTPFDPLAIYRVAEGLWVPPAPGEYTAIGTITGSSYAGLSASCAITVVEEE